MTRHPNIARPDTAGPLAAWISTWDLSLRAAGKSPRTRFTYGDAAKLFGAWLAREYPDVRDMDQLTRDHLRAFFAWLQEGGRPCPHALADADAPPCSGYGKGYVSQLARAIQQFTKFWALEEDLPNPLAGVTLPAAYKLGEKVPPVLETKQLEALIKDAERGRDFESRRDAAILRLFACTGCRLAELAALKVKDLRTEKLEFTVVGKGGKERIVRYDTKAALALSRYLRSRETRKAAKTTTGLWVGQRASGAMTPNGIRQVIERRGEKIGLDIHPHMFRHTFAHRWLDGGGKEGDLMQLAGWDSAQMLRHYGASARSARARRAYDDVAVMGNI